MEKNESIRTTRLAFIITLFGGAWYLTKGIFLMWYSTYTTSASRYIFGIDHLLAFIILTVMLGVFFTLVIYIYRELQTFLTNDISELENLKVKADKAYLNVFKSIKGGITILSCFLVIISVISGEFTKAGLLRSLIYIAIGLGISVVSFCIIMFFLYIKEKKFYRNIISRTKVLPILKYPTKPKSSSIKLIFSFFHNNIQFFYIGLVVAAFTIPLTLTALEGKREVNIEIEESKEMSLSLQLQDFKEPKIDIVIFNQDSNEIAKSFSLGKEEMKHSIVEVIQEEEFFKSNKNNHELNDVILGADILQIDKSNYISTYQIELINHLKDGKNSVQVLIQDLKDPSNTSINFWTEIYKVDDGFDVVEKKKTIKL